MAETLKDYLSRLSGLLLSAQATGPDGVSVSLDDGAKRAVEMILQVKGSSRKMMLIGNGGSAAIASHMQNDLCDGAGVRAMNFYDLPLLTAVSNDHGYESVFERPVDVWVDAGDLLLAVSSSGQSHNILRAVRLCVSRGCRIMTFSGFRADNPLREMGDLNFYVPSDVYGCVELVHAALGHFLTDSARNAQGK